MINKKLKSNDVIAFLAYIRRVVYLQNLKGADTAVYPLFVFLTLFVFTAFLIHFLTMKSWC